MTPASVHCSLPTSRPRSCGPAESDLSGALDAHEATDTYDHHNAEGINFFPTGTIAATDVQAAIEEVAAEAMDYLGVWSDATAYVPGDVVSLDGVASVCVVANAGVRPTPGHIQNLGSTGNGTAAQTTTVLSPAAKTVTVGDRIVVGWGAYYDSGVSGVTDNLGNVYTLVEHRGSVRGSVLYSAPVTVGGSITTITVSHASAQYVGMMAAEFGNIVALSVAGGGLNAASGTPATWVDSKTIPAHGLAVGWVVASTATVETAGSASGTPSTPITLSGSFLNGAAVSGSLGYAIAGGSDVTSFSGTTVFDTGAGTDWVGAGGVFAVAWERLTQPAAHVNPGTATAADIANALIAAGLMAAS